MSRNGETTFVNMGCLQGGGSSMTELRRRIQPGVLTIPDVVIHVYYLKTPHNGAMFLCHISTLTRFNWLDDDKSNIKKTTFYKRN